MDRKFLKELAEPDCTHPSYSYYVKGLLDGFEGALSETDKQPDHDDRIEGFLKSIPVPPWAR